MNSIIPTGTARYEGLPLGRVSDHVDENGHDVQVQDGIMTAKTGRLAVWLAWGVHYWQAVQQRHLCSISRETRPIVDVRATLIIFGTMVMVGRDGLGSRWTGVETLSSETISQLRNPSS
jgi:hypothetical protein